MSNFQAARFTSFATLLPIDLTHTFQHHFTTESSTPCSPCRTLTGSRGGPEALLLTDIMAESVARGLITVWISHYGVP
ncbi:hypothetical protein MRX96_032930 [Rhipicephalus microplus]